MSKEQNDCKDVCKNAIKDYVIINQNDNIRFKAITCKDAIIQYGKYCGVISTNTADNKTDVFELALNSMETYEQAIELFNAYCRDKSYHIQSIYLIGQWLYNSDKQV